MAYSRIDRGNSSDGNGSVRLPEFLVGVCDSTVGAYLFAGGTTVAHELVGLSNTGIADKVILGKKTDDLGGGSACLCNCLRDILGTLAYA